MSMKEIFKAAAAPSFWGISEAEAHTLALKSGVIIPASEWSNTFSHAKACYFVSRARKRRTKNELVNLACALYLNEPLKNVFN